MTVNWLMFMTKSLSCQHNIYATQRSLPITKCQDRPHSIPHYYQKSSLEKNFTYIKIHQLGSQTTFKDQLFLQLLRTTGIQHLFQLYKKLK